MKRRRFVQAIMGAPAATALIAQPPAGQQPVTQQPGPAQPAPGIPLNPTQPVQPPRTAAMELPKLDASIPDVAAEMMPRFFTREQFGTLRKLSDVLMPSIGSRPGALDAKAPEFLDFLIGESPTERQDIYRSGLDELNAEAQKRHGKPFADLDTAQADALLAPLRSTWTYEPAADPLARFLPVAKQDVRVATVNSREYSAASNAGGGARRFGGGLYWYPLD